MLFKWTIMWIRDDRDDLLRLKNLVNPLVVIHSLESVVRSDVSLYVNLNPFMIPLIGILRICSGYSQILVEVKVNQSIFMSRFSQIRRYHVHEVEFFLRFNKINIKISTDNNFGVHVCLPQSVHDEAQLFLHDWLTCIREEVSVY